jgi:hypothetical protein
MEARMRIHVAVPVVAALAVAIAVSLTGVAWPEVISERTYSEASSGAQDAPVLAERTYSDAPAGAVASAAADVPSPPSDDVAPATPADDGLGALAIVAIVLGGVLALGGLAYTAVRFAHHGHPAH